jgi:hypothetical protein
MSRAAELVREAPAKSNRGKRRKRLTPALLVLGSAADFTVSFG